jgi:hypothetical protein
MCSFVCVCLCVCMRVSVFNLCVLVCVCLVNNCLYPNDFVCV